MGRREKQEETIERYKLNNKVHEKGYTNSPLTEVQKESNREKSRTRARVEHVFGFMEQSMNRLYIKPIGIERAVGSVGPVNPTYDLFRYEQLTRLDGTVMPNL